MVGLISFLVVISIFGIGVIWWIYAQSREPNYNGLVWKLAGSIERIKRNPEGQKPFFFIYRWYDTFPRRRPLYLWEEYKDDKDKIRIRHWEPKLPVDYKLIDNHDYVTTNELYDNTDWSCAKRFETIPNKLTQAVKLGAAVVMVCVCVIGMIMVVDMVNKPSTQPLQAQTSTDIVEVNR